MGRSHTFCYQTVARQRGPISGQLQRKQRKHRTFLTLFLYTILKYLFIKILCFRCRWPINGVIKPFVAAQNLHKTGTELHRTPARRRNTPSPIPHLAPKLHPNVQPNPPRHGLTAQNLFSVKPKKKQDRFSHNLKVANRSFSVAESSPARAGAERSEREKGGNSAPAGPGAQPLARLW